MAEVAATEKTPKKDPKSMYLLREFCNHQWRICCKGGQAAAGSKDASSLSVPRDTFQLAKMISIDVWRKDDVRSKLFWPFSLSTFLSPFWWLWTLGSCLCNSSVALPTLYPKRELALVRCQLPVADRVVLVHCRSWTETCPSHDAQADRILPPRTWNAN